MAKKRDYIPPQSVSGAAGGIRKLNSVLETLSPEQIAQLTPKARAILSKTPVTVNSGLDKNVGQSGTGHASARYNIFGQVANPKITLAQAALPTTLPFHEALHIADFMSGLPSSKLVNTPETRRALAAAYYEGLSNPNFGNESHIPQREAFAQAGMYGYGNIPPEMRKYYQGIIVPPLGGKKVRTYSTLPSQLGVPSYPTRNNQKAYPVPAPPRTVTNTNRR